MKIPFRKEKHIYQNCKYHGRHYYWAKFSAMKYPFCWICLESGRAVSMPLEIEKKVVDNRQGLTQRLDWNILNLMNNEQTKTNKKTTLPRVLKKISDIRK